MKNIIKIASVYAISLFAAANANAKAEKFILDPLHTNITWSANHADFSNPSGKFAKSSGVMFLDESSPAKSSFKVEVDTTSIITGFELFDKHLKSSDFLNSEKFKTVKFVSTKVEVLSKDTAKIHGKLTLLGVTNPVIFEAKLNKIGENPFTKKKTAGFSATTTIKRSEFGMKYGLPMISDEVKISVETEGSVE